MHIDSTRKRTNTERLVRFIERQGLIRARDLVDIRIDRKTLARAVEDKLVERRERGMYVLATGQQPQRLAEACKRVPGGVICLFSALHFHHLLVQETDHLWMAIDRKARLPRLDETRIKFVRFSGEALKQGVVNLKVGGVQIRVYSPMKTIADCYKYRNKIGPEVGPEALKASVALGSYSRYRLLHFARICRVEKLVALNAPSHLRQQHRG